MLDILMPTTVSAHQDATTSASSPPSSSWRKMAASTNGTTTTTTNNIQQTPNPSPIPTLSALVASSLALKSKETPKEAAKVIVNEASDVQPHASDSPLSVECTSPSNSTECSTLMDCTPSQPDVKELYNREVSNSNDEEEIKEGSTPKPFVKQPKTKK